MADQIDFPHARLVEDLAGPAVSGWMSGNPDYEANRQLSPAQKLGSNGVPGWYDEMVQQWPRLAALLGQGRAEAAAGRFEFVPCGASETDADGDETPEEAGWNDAFTQLVHSRLGIEQADGLVYGDGQLIRYLYDLPWYGVIVAEPYWLDTAGDPMADGTLVIRPLMPSAIQRWQIDFVTRRVVSMWYQSAPSWTMIPYEDLIHVTHNAGPGEYTGRAELRPLIAPFSAWREGIRSGADATRAAKGRLVLEAPDREDKVEMARMQAIVAGFDGGRVDSFVKPHGAAHEILFPGTPPDFSTWMTSLDRYAEVMFADRTSAMGIGASGSRAAAETIGARDDSARFSQWELMLDRCVQRIAAWIARQTGYTGRVRRATLAVVDQAASPAERLALYAGIESLRAQGAPIAVLRAAASEIGLDPDIIAPLPTPAPKPQTTGLIAELHDSCAPGCGCEKKKHNLILADVSGGWTDRDGATVDMWRGPIEIEVDGVTYRPELSVSLADAEAIRAVADAELQAELDPIIAEHRAALWGAYATGYSEREATEIYNDFRERYERAILDYQGRIAAMTAASVRAEADAQVVGATPTTREGLPNDDPALEDWSIRQADQARLGARAAADSMASRVQGEVTTAASNGVTPTNYTPRQTTAGIAREAHGSGARVEASATIQQGADKSGKKGMVVIAAVRSSMRDGRRVCPWCQSQDAANNDATKWRFPEDTARFLSYMSEHSLPDQSCEGGPRCRCTITLVWGVQPEREQTAA